MQKIKEIYLLCNAHLDPVWLWQRQEGVAEAISTFRVAAKFCEEYDSFIFNHNESLLYEWVEEYEPALFKRIQELVKAGKWHIFGGWYLQPDCTQPSGEGLIRQIEAGRKYFQEKFGVTPTTAMGVDAPGHSRGLVQILRKWGYDSYLFQRGNVIPEREFIWKGYDGSEIIAHKIFEGYNTLKGCAVNKIERALKTWEQSEGYPVRLVTWGIGNHGGGASEEDLKRIAQYQEEHPEVKLIHSYSENYIATVDVSGLPVVESSLSGLTENTSLDPQCLVGDTISMANIKQKYRQLENELILCEKMLTQSGAEYDRVEMEKAEKALLYSQFHDILGGELSKKAEAEALRCIEYGREIISRYCTKAFFKMCEGQKAGKAGEIPVLVYNPNPYPVEEIVEVEFQLEDQNWTKNEVTLAKVRDEDGNYLSVQNEKEDSSINLDWRKRIAFQAILKPMTINRFDCELYRKDYSKRPIEKCDEDDIHFIVKTESMEVRINKQTGLLDRYRVDGKEYLKEGSAIIRVYEDNEDCCGMNVNGYYHKEESFRTVSKDEANRFNGYPGTDMENVRVIENGPVRCKIQAIFKYSNSWAVVTYTIPKKGKYLDLKVKMNVNDANKMYKLAFETTLEESTFVGQTAFGREVLLKNEREVPYQKWCALMTETEGFSVMNRGTYSGSAKDGCLNISLLHTPLYSCHPIPGRELAAPDRNYDHIDIGEREFEYRITTDCEYLDADSEIYNQQTYAWSFFPAGEETADHESGSLIREKLASGIALSNKHMVLSSLQVTEEEKLSIRLFNSSEKIIEGTLSIGQECLDVTLEPFEVKTYLL